MADNKEMIQCPACSKSMTKIFVPEKGINIDICTDGCGGIFFDNRELEKFDSAEDNIDEILEAIKDKTFEKVDESTTRICPSCKVPMVKMGAGVPDVVIDVCNTCGAKFLDNGELQKIREAVEEGDNEKFDAFLNSLYRENLKDVLGKNAEMDIKSSPRRQFFENLVSRHLKR